MNIIDFKKKFDPHLIKFLDKKLLQYKNYTNDPFILSLISHSKKLVLSVGKRVRPYVAYLMYKSAGGKKDAEAIQLFVGLELFHNFCLVHDDIIDRGSRRHGVKTLHTLISDKLKYESRLGDETHIGSSQAILIGDLLFAWSYEIFGTCEKFDYKKMNRARAIFNKMIDEVVIGQMIDVDITTRRQASELLVKEKMTLKTARYTFSRPMEIGLSLISESKKLKNFCSDFGTNLGIGFQIQDDMLDLTSTPEKLKKEVFSDLRERNHNYFTQYIFDNGTLNEKKMLNKVFGNKAVLLNGERTKIINLFKSSGAIDNGVRSFKNYFAKAKSSLEKANFQKEHKLKWLDLIDYIQKRAE